MTHGNAGVCTKAQWLQWALCWAGKYVLSSALFEMQPIPVATRSGRGLGRAGKVRYPLLSIHVITDAYSCPHWWRVEGTVNPMTWITAPARARRGADELVSKGLYWTLPTSKMWFGLLLRFRGDSMRAWALPPYSSSDPFWADKLLGFHGSLRHAQISTQALKRVQIWSHWLAMSLHIINRERYESQTSFSLSQKAAKKSLSGKRGQPES